MAVVGGSFLSAMGRADAAVHVEDDHLRRSAVVHPVDPNAGQGGQRRQIIIRRQPFRLEPSHLAGRGGHPIEALTVHDGAHDRIVREALGVIHVLVSGEPTEHRLTKKSH